MTTDGPDPLRQGMSTSRAAAIGGRLREGLTAAQETLVPRAVDAFRRSSLGRIWAAYPGSGLQRVATWSLDVARQSWLFRWLTKEPEPEVIVIDLRETWTVGQSLAFLERVLAPLARAAPTARVTALARLVATHPVPLASAVLAGLVLASLVESWPGTDAFVLAAHAFVLVAAGLGLTVDDSRAALADSLAYAALVALLAPPEREV